MPYDMVVALSREPASKTKWSMKLGVREKNSGKTETYTGLTGRKLKQRWQELERNFNKPDDRNKSSLSVHAWELKGRGIDYEISWKILDRANEFNPATKICNLCLREKYFITYADKSSTLNKRTEIFNT